MEPLLLCAAGILVVGLIWVLLRTRTLAIEEKEFLTKCLNTLRGSRRAVVVVTGATSGIGEKLCELLAGECNAHVYLGYRSLDRGLASQARILARYPRAQVSLLPCNVTDAASVRAAARSLRGSHECIDFLVNNAGVMPVDRLRWGSIVRAVLCCRLGSFLETGRPGAGTPHFMEGGASGSQLDTHVLGHLLLLQELLPVLHKGRSRVVWSASRAAEGGAVDWAHLAAQGGLALGPPSPPLFSLPKEAYAEAKTVQELVSRQVKARMGITSVCVCPGFVETPIAPPFFAAMSPLVRHARALAPSMTLDLERGCTAHIGAMVAPERSLDPVGKYVLRGGGIAMAKEGVVAQGMEEEAWAVCQGWLSRGQWATNEHKGGASSVRKSDLHPPRRRHSTTKN
jgi:NAD(P)-dependent dehydrogenase (short-subunit alcohol dehydrogenase family)